MTPGLGLSCATATAPGSCIPHMPFPVLGLVTLRDVSVSVHSIRCSDQGSRVDHACDGVVVQVSSLCNATFFSSSCVCSIGRTTVFINHVIDGSTLCYECLDV